MRVPPTPPASPRTRSGAHAKVPISFDHEPVIREVNSLKTLKAIWTDAAEAARGLHLDNKTWFLLITKITLILLDGLQEHRGTADEALKDAVASKRT